MLDKIKVFAVEDQPLMLQSIEEVIGQGLADDMEYVGGADRNSSDLLEHIRELQADVVLVDLLLSNELVPGDVRKNPRGELSGIGIIDVLHRQFGNSVKIIAFSHFLGLRDLAIKYGAHGFISKGATGEKLRESIRDIAYGRLREYIPEFVGRITGLKLYDKDRAFSLVGDCNTSKKIPLDPRLWVFLYYLALERKQQGEISAFAEFWVEKIDQKGEERDLSKYEMKNVELWTQLTEEFGILNRDAVLYANVIAGWCTRIKKSFENCHKETESTPTLISVPGSGLKSAGTSSVYTLNPDITDRTIEIYD